MSISENGRRLTILDVINLWRNDSIFCDDFIHRLAETRYDAFFWEMPPITREVLDRAFEYVVIETRAFAGLESDPRAFTDKLLAADAVRSVTAFPNLHGDAVLIVPRPRAQASIYGHIASFIRNAPASQKHDLLAAIGDEIVGLMQRSDKPLWVSTSGLGVPWLHVRLDSFPKYYSYPPYRDSGAAVAR